MGFKDRVVKIIPQSKNDYNIILDMLKTRTFYPTNIPPLKINDEPNPAVESFDYRQLFIFMGESPDGYGFLVYTRDVTDATSFTNSYFNFGVFTDTAPVIEMHEYTDIVNGSRTMTGRYIFLSWDYQLVNNK